MRWSPSAATPGPPPASATEEETLVGLVHLLQEDESEDSVGAQAGIVWCKALPQAEEALVAHDLHQHILDRKAGRALRLGPGLWGPLLPSGRALTKGGEGPPLDLELTSSEGHSHKETLRWPNMLQGGSPSMTMTPAPNLPPTSCLPSYRVTWTALAAPHSVVTDLETVSDCLLSGAQVSSLSPLPG